MNENTTLTPNGELPDGNASKQAVVTGQEVHDSDHDPLDPVAISEPASAESLANTTDVENVDSKGLLQDASKKAPKRTEVQEGSLDGPPQSSESVEADSQADESSAMAFSIDDDMDEIDDGLGQEFEAGTESDDVAEEAVEQVQPKVSPRVADRKQLNKRKSQFARSQERYEEDIQRAAAWASLLQAKREKQILSGKLMSTRLWKAQNGEQTMYAVVNYAGFFRVLIPFNEFFVMDPLDYEGIDTTTSRGRDILYLRQDLILMKIIGATIPFMVQAARADEDGNYVVFASRRNALTKQAQKNFSPDASGTAVIMENDIVPATVLSIGDFGILANVGGVDTRIPSRNLTFQYLPSHEALAQKYKVGSQFPVMIVGISHRKDGVITCTVSGRRAETERFKRSGIRMLKNEEALGKITFVRIREDGRSASVFLVLEDLGNIPAIASTITPDGFGNFPRLGDTVRVRYQSYDEETGVTFVRILRVHETTQTPY